MNAARIIIQAGYDVERLRRSLAPVDIDSVNVWPASRWLRSLWRPGVKGVTQGRWVFVDPVLFDDRERLARLVIHELVHVRQFAIHGYVRFMLSYILGYLRGRRSGLAPRDAYLAIPAEQEARELTNLLTST